MIKILYFAIINCHLGQNSDVSIKRKYDMEYKDIIFKLKIFYCPYIRTKPRAKPPQVTIDLHGG